MASRSHFSRVGWFALRLALIAPLALALWGLCIPAYAWLIGHSAALILRVAGYSIEGVVVDPSGILNRSTTLGFDLGQRVSSAPVALVVSNIAAFATLVMATRRLRWRGRIRALLIGGGILAATHITHLVVFFAFARTIARYPQVPTAVAQVFITLPFLLWIALAYWQSDYEPSPAARTESPPTTAQ